MKKLILPFYLVVMIVFIGCEKQNEQTEIISPNKADQVVHLKNSPVCEVNLIAAQNLIVGTVSSTFNTSSEMVVTYTITDPAWCIVETHLDVQSNPDNFFLTNSGNPKIGHFPFSETLNCESTWSQTIDLNTILEWNEGDIMYIAAHAILEDQSNYEETAWGEGQSFPGNSWAMYFECEPPECGIPIVDSRDGKIYNTVQIGDQCWLKENLNVGTMINSNNNLSNNGTIEKYCYGNDTSDCITYGGLYQWDEMMQYVTIEGAQGICPEGWHIPTDDEWKILEGNVDSQYGVGDSEWDGIYWRGFDAGRQIKFSTEWFGYGND